MHTGHSLPANGLQVNFLGIHGSVERRLAAKLQKLFCNLFLFLIYCNKGTSLNRLGSVMELLGHPVVSAATTRVVSHFALRWVVGHLAGHRLVQKSINVVHQWVETRPEVEMRVVVN